MNSKTGLIECTAKSPSRHVPDSPNTSLAAGLVSERTDERRGVTSRLSRVGWERLRRMGHIVLGKERVYSALGYQLTLPPAHRLPEFQAAFPTYDNYARPILARLGAAHRRPVLIDIGANVGDTSAMTLAASPHWRVVAVEGARDFVEYLRANLRPYRDRVDVVPAFLMTTGGEALSYQSNGSTGRFVAATEALEASQQSATIEQIWPQSSDFVLWKSDTDGLDLPLAVQHWPQLAQADALWLEWDTAVTPEGPAIARALTERLSDGGWSCVVFDCYGRKMTRLSSSQLGVLLDLGRWAAQVRQGLQPAVNYFDVWASRDEAVIAAVLGS